MCRQLGQQHMVTLHLCAGLHCPHVVCTETRAGTTQLAARNATTFCLLSSCVGSQPEPVSPYSCGLLASCRLMVLTPRHLTSSPLDTCSAHWMSCQALRDVHSCSKCGVMLLINCCPQVDELHRGRVHNRWGMAEQLPAFVCSSNPPTFDSR